MNGIRDRKRALRRELRARRAAVPAVLRSAWSKAIASRAVSLPEWRDAAVIHLFIGSLPGEVETRSLAQAALLEGKTLLCPRVAGAGLESRRVRSLDDLAPGYHGLPEPDPGRCELVPAGEAGLLLVPGLAFTERGDRLGMGSAFYDRLLAGTAAPAVALAFELQLVDELPVAPHDRPVDAIITELRGIRCRREAQMPEPGLAALPVTRVAGFRESVPFAELRSAFDRLAPRAAQAFADAGIAAYGPVSAIYHSIAETCEITIGLELIGGDAPAGLSVAEISGGEAVKLDVRGPHERIPEEGLKLGQWCEANGRAPTGIGLERYVAGPDQDADPANWLTELYLPLQQPASRGSA